MSCCGRVHPILRRRGCYRISRNYSFPSLFAPRYDKDDGKWHIYHDLTGWERIREARKPNFGKWCEYMMWRSDGAPARHATFSLVAYNNKLRTALSKQATFVYNTGDTDPNTTMQEIIDAEEENRQLRKYVDKMAEKKHIHLGNIPGTQQYMKSTYHEFEATAFITITWNSKLQDCSTPEV